MGTETNAYVAALKNKGTKDVVFNLNKRAEIIKKQGKKCALCKKDLKQYYYNFRIEPKTKELTAICSDCLIDIPKR